MLVSLVASAEAAPREESRAARRDGSLADRRRPSRDVVVKLSALFALDAFGGGFVVQSFVAYWFYLRFGVDAGTLGQCSSGRTSWRGVSALLASRLAARFGLIMTMVATHLPSNVLLMLVPLMPTLPLAVAVLLRAVQHQPDGRADEAVLHHGGGEAGRTGGRRRHHRGGAHHRRGDRAGVRRPDVREPALMNLPFFIAGALKIAYDLLLYRAFRSVEPPEEVAVIR